MYKTKKRLSIVIVLSLFWLFSISPVLAEEPTGSVDESSGTEAAVVETVVEIPDADDEIVEAVVEIPDADDEIVEAVVEIPDTDEAVVETVIDLPNTDEAVVETIVEIPSTDEELAETVVDIPDTADEPEYLNSDVLNVIVPVMVSVTIDPLELAGKGQVYSNTYKIKNYGDTDVLLTFTDIQVAFADDTSFAASADPFVEKIGSNLKAIYMMLDFGREDVPPAIITDFSTKSAVSIPLSTTQGDMAENSLVQFNFSGNVNEASALNWHDNDVKISLNYTLEAVPPPAEEITPTAIEIPVTEEPTPITEEPTPITEEPTPITEEPTPITEEPTPESPVESDATESPPESASPDYPAPQDSPSEPST